MAEPAADRDGLELDQLPIRLGPFFPAFPSGLVLDVRCQGDVIQEVTIGENPFAGMSTAQYDAIHDPFRRGLQDANCGNSPRVHFECGPHFHLDASASRIELCAKRPRPCGSRPEALSIRDDRQRHRDAAENNFDRPLRVSSERRGRTPTWERASESRFGLRS